MKQVAAFFDVDGTIFRDSLLVEHFKLMIDYQLLSYEDWTSSIQEKFDNWSNRIGDYDEYIDEISNKYAKVLKNINPEDVEYIAKRIIKLKGDKVYRYTRAMVEYHKKMNHKLIIISGSPTFLVEKMAKKLGVDIYEATTYILDNNKYTGDVIPMWDSISKQEAIEKLAEKYNLDLDKSYAYGDTTGDYSMLCMVGNPVAMNPAKRLLNRIENNDVLLKKIKVIVERKDVIYELNSTNLQYLKGGENDTNK